ncbi:MAG: BatD family protein [Bacteroidales bacterium]|jgi:hypothetical protein|nr:BatD family protein [Bacteroidales bacterium]
MRITLKYIFLFIIAIAGSFACSRAIAQDAALTANAPKQVYEGDNFQVQFSFNAQGASNFKAPTFRGFDILGGPYTGQSSSSSYINGRVSHTFSISYTYQLRAIKAGNYPIAAASISANGNQYSSQPFEIKVLPASSRPANQASGSRRSASRASGAGNAGQQPAESANISDKDLFIRVTANKSNPYKGEEIILTYKVYTSVAISQYSIEKIPSYKGFWSEDLGEIDERKQEIIDGKKFLVLTFKKTAIFPQEAGSFTIEPMEMTAYAQVRAARRKTGSIFDIFDDPFFAAVQNVEKKIKSNSLTIKVKELPDEPQNFNGTVGDYDITFDYDAAKQHVSGEAITFKFSVSGHGNIEMISPPTIMFPPDFEMYEPQITSDKNASMAGVSGSMTFEYTAVPRSSGRFVIPSFDYTFFNPAEKEHKTINIPEMSIDVAQGKENSTTSYGSRAIKDDIEHIKTGILDFREIGSKFFMSVDFFILVAIVVLLFIAALITARSNAKKQLDIAGIKNRKALKEAKKYLRKAEKFMNTGKYDEFYTEISLALWGFISNKLNIPPADLSMDTVRDTLLAGGVSEQYTGQFISTLDDCEFARFAPKGNTSQNMREIYDSAIKVIINFEG